MCAPVQAIFIYTMTDITPTEYNGYVFPWWADMLGWMMGASTLLPFLVGIAYRYFKDKPVSEEEDEMEFYFKTGNLKLKFAV